MVNLPCKGGSGGGRFVVCGGEWGTTPHTTLHNTPNTPLTHPSHTPHTPLTHPSHTPYTTPHTPLTPFTLHPSHHPSHHLLHTPYTTPHTPLTPFTPHTTPPPPYTGILRDSMLLKMTDQQWDEVVTCHLKGTFVFTQVCCCCIILTFLDLEF